MTFQELIAAETRDVGVSDLGRRLRQWSGRDGVDDGGDGSWSKSGKDIVLEIGR